MECLVCGSPAKENRPQGDYREIDCPDCGVFRVSGSLIAIQRGRIFDVAPTRITLERTPRVGDIPILSTIDEELLYVPGTTPRGKSYSS